MNHPLPARLDRAALLRELRSAPQHMELTLERGGVDVNSRTVDLAFASEEPYQRAWGIEILDLSPQSVDMSRLSNNAALLLNHNADQQIGVVETARISSDGKARARARFSRSALGQEILQDVADGIRTKTSVAYRINDIILEKQDTELPTYRVTSWTPYELSIVAVPADDTVGVGRAARSRQGNTTMQDQRSQRRSALAGDRELIKFSSVPAVDRRAFRGYLEAVAQEGEEPGDMQAAYQDFREQAIGTYAECFPFEAGREEVRALETLALGDPSMPAETFRKKIMQLVEKHQGRPQLDTGRLEDDRLAPDHQSGSRPLYGEGVVRENAGSLQKGGKVSERSAYSMGMWIRSQVGDKQAARWCAENGLVTRTMTEGVFQSGGALVPELLADTIINNREEYGAIFQYAQIWPVNSATLKVPVSGQGLTMAAVGENDATPTSDLALTQISLTPKEFVGGTRASKSLLEDSPTALGNFIIAEFSRVLAQTQDGCGFVGNGTSTYGGIQGALWKLENQAQFAGSKKAAASTHKTWATIDLTDLVGVMGALPNYARKNAAWYVSSVGKDLLLTRLMAAAGGNNVQSISQGATESFLGYPVRVSQVLPSGAGTDYSNKCMLVFGDLARAVAFGDRRTLMIYVDISRYVEFRQTFFQIASRFDVNAHMSGTTATVAGPIIGLFGTT